MSKRLIFAAAITLAISPTTLWSQVVPYATDADTLHLWHLDESTTPVTDSVAGGQSLQGLLNNATLGNASFSGFGSALNTFTSNGGTANASSYKGGLLLARPALADGFSDNVPNTFGYTGSDGAFTYEAIVKLDAGLTPLGGLGSAPSNLWMQIISMDDETASSRVFQFRLQDSATPSLQFLPFTAAGASVPGLLASVPTTGTHALAIDTWFHVAVSYNGLEGTTDNMALYWTRLDSGVTEANQIGTATMAADLNGAFGDFVVGNEARNAGTGEAENFPGLIDEVRISGVARAADEFVFAVPEPSSFVLAGVVGLGLLQRRRRRA
jgi:hypothetical protein